MMNWRARHEGMMHFGIFSVTETQLLAIAVFTLTGIFGCDIWSMKLLGLIDTKDIVVGFLFFMAIYTSYYEYVAVQQYYKQNKNKKDPGQIYELLHMVLFVTGFIC